MLRLNTLKIIAKLKFLSLRTILCKKGFVFFVFEIFSEQIRIPALGFPINSLPVTVYWFS